MELIYLELKKVLSLEHLKSTTSQKGNNFMLGMKSSYPRIFKAFLFFLNFRQVKIFHKTTLKSQHKTIKNN